MTLGLLGAGDFDDDSSDNFSGLETFEPEASVDAQGIALVNQEVGLEDGAYEAELEGLSLDWDGLRLDPGRIVLQGTVQESGNAGLMGMVIPLDQLAAALEGSPEAYLVDYLPMVADRDLDGDSVNDAISASFVFESVPCTLR